MCSGSGLTASVAAKSRTQYIQDFSSRLFKERSDVARDKYVRDERNVRMFDGAAGRDVCWQACILIRVSQYTLYCTIPTPSFSSRKIFPNKQCFIWFQSRSFARKSDRNGLARRIFFQHVHRKSADQQAIVPSVFSPKLQTALSASASFEVPRARSLNYYCAVACPAIRSWSACHPVRIICL